MTKISLDQASMCPQRDWKNFHHLIVSDAYDYIVGLTEDRGNKQMMMDGAMRARIRINDNKN